MGIKNTKLGGADFSDELVTDYDLNDTFNAAANIAESDQTGGSIASSIVETMIGEVIFDAGTAIGGVLIIATGKVLNDQMATNTGTVKLYTGTNVAFGSNTERKSISRVNSDEDHNTECGWTLACVVTAETWANTVYVQITGKNSDSDGNSRVICESLIVVGIGGSN